jgi:hypothetical protein
MPPQRSLVFGDQLPSLTIFPGQLTVLLVLALLVLAQPALPSSLPTCRISMAQSNMEDAEFKIGMRDKKVPWYTESLDGKLGDAARTLLENYSKIPAEKVESHIYEVVS